MEVVIDIFFHFVMYIRVKEKEGKKSRAALGSTHRLSRMEADVNACLQ